MSSRRSGGAHAIEDRAFRALHVSKTFHGRDVFAVTAGLIARGELAASCGPAVNLKGTLPWGPRVRGIGRVVHIDHFGNLVTDLPPSEAGKIVSVAGRQLAVLGTYEDVPTGELLAYVGSAKTIEIAVRDGRADQRLGVTRGTQILPATATPPYR